MHLLTSKAKYRIYSCNWRLIAAELARFSDVWHNFFRNALNLGIRGDRTEHVI